MLKTAFAATAFAAMALASQAQAQALTAGSIAFTSFNADEDGWSVVLLADVAANTTIYFSDNNYNGSAFSNTESAHQWSTGASVLAAGTVVRFSATDTAARAASAGTFTVVFNTNPGISATDDTVYAYLGTSATAPTTFLAAAANGVGSALTGTGLSYGTNAIKLANSSDFGQYTGVRTGLNSFASYLPLVADIANWQDLGAGSFATTVPNTTAFTVTPVPEPANIALMLAGLGVIGAAVRRRKS